MIPPSSPHLPEQPHARHADAPRLPRSVGEWIRVFGPGAIIASLTIGTGELIFSSRGGALFGYDILYVFVLISLLKWGLVVSTSRHMILTGVHPYERLRELPGPRGWMPIMLLLMATVAIPVWISFHAGVLGNLTSWITGTGATLGGGMDYVWGAGVLILVLGLSLAGGYTVLERVQLLVVSAMVFCAGLSLVLYNPDWLELLAGLVPRRLAYPEWLPERYPEIARHSIWIETTRYVGAIGGAGFDYLAYTSWLREKRWGVLPGRASPQLLAEIAADPQHEVRQWINAPLVDCTISFALVVVFSAVFVASGALFLEPEAVVPDEENMLSLQARFVTGIHPLLLPLYACGAFLTMLGTLYGTIEVACSVADEIARSLAADWQPRHARTLRRFVLGWCGVIAVGILGWLLVRQSSHAGTEPTVAAASSRRDPGASTPGREREEATAAGSRRYEDEAVREPRRVEKPRLLLALLTPVNLFTGVLSCGLICGLVLWMDRRWLPPALQPPMWLTALNVVSLLVFVAVGVKGYWDTEARSLVIGSMAGIFAVSLVVALIAGRRWKG